MSIRVKKAFYEFSSACLLLCVLVVLIFYRCVHSPYPTLICDFRTYFLFIETHKFLKVR